MNAGDAPRMTAPADGIAGAARDAAQRTAARKRLRQDMIARREALPPTDAAQRSAAVCAHLTARFSADFFAFFPDGRAKTIGFCWPVQNEPDLRPAIRTWLAQGGHACLPVVVAPGEPLAFRPWTPATPLAPDRYGIPTPSEGDLVLPDVLLIPVNAVDGAGFRLGYGGGFFDRTLARLAAVGHPVVTLGVGFDFQRVDTIHPEPHDAPLMGLVTESGFVEFD
ncbi:5-formyltetrahydrofolate cyclo-ligase [Oryzomicrobium sp.]|uniref:5-formyltetrahydrofolate cyclo-ligase n=1 Tax=Oryzomicrobium sp. TaxID=1911578 RepID=UPI002FE0AAD6